MNFKKKVNGSWTDTPHYIHNTSTDTLTTLPAVLYPNDTTATVGLKGNEQHTGTPTPQNPVMPQGTGERTGNLFDGTLLSGFYKDASFALDTSGGTVYKSITIHLVAGTYTVSFEHTVHIVRQILDSVYSENIGSNISSYTFTTTTDAYFGISFRLSQSSSTPWDNSNIMLNLGSTPLPYEPFGYIIPISSASTTTPVYLGEVETTRKIKKYEFTGSETWSAGAENYYSFVLQTYGDGVPYSAIICSHCSNATINNTGKAVFFKKTDFPDITTGEELKQYCSNQYTNGTPVTVWYVLATEETGIVNEPIRKIGDYADEVSNVSIPITAGGDTLSVETTVQPSEVTVNYKGWHPAIVHEHTNGAWT